ncbi:beta-1,6-N-acetylglucosaminyltransferase [Bacteroidota bacterium]
MTNIAFLILAHHQIDLVYKQIDLLDSENHYFFIHLDQKYKSNIDPLYCEKNNVFFTNKRIKVHWGGFSIVLATITLLDESFNHSQNFDYFVLMSGQCLPIKPKQYIDDFLRKHPGKSFIQMSSLPDNNLHEDGMGKFHYPAFFDQLSFLRKDSIRIGKKQYELKKLLFRGLKRIYILFGLKRKVHFNILCYGSQWWVLHISSVKHILESYKTKKTAFNFFKYTWAPDELFFQILLYNSPLKDTLINESLWYIDWNTNGPPKTLSIQDYGNLENSNVLFARKFDYWKSAELINRLSVDL